MFPANVSGQAAEEPRSTQETEKQLFISGLAWPALAIVAIWKVIQGMKELSLALSLSESGGLDGRLQETLLPKFSLEDGKGVIGAEKEVEEAASA